MDADELVRAVRAALDDLEAHAHKDIWAADQATPGNWRARYGVNLPHSWVETESTPVARLDAARHEADALLIARFKPDNVRERAAAVLRQVAAMREIVERHAAFDFPPDPDANAFSDYSSTPRCDHCYKDWPCPDLLSLAHGLGIDLEGTDMTDRTGPESVPNLPCPKCGSGETSMRYCDGIRREVPDHDLICRGGDPEHLHRRCGRCDYRWRTETLDHG